MKKAEEAEDLLGAWVNADKTLKTDDKGDLGFSWDEVSAFGFSLADVSEGFLFSLDKISGVLLGASSDTFVAGLLFSKESIALLGVFGLLAIFAGEKFQGRIKELKY